MCGHAHHKGYRTTFVSNASGEAAERSLAGLDLLRKIQPYFEERTTSSSTARERIDVQSALIHLDAYPTAGRVIALGLPI